MIELQVLGPFAVYQNGSLLPESALRDAKARSLLKYLTVRQGQVIPQEELVSALWPQSAPAAGRSSLQAAISYLRRVLEPGRMPGEPYRLICRRPPGYLLAPSPDCRIDLELYAAAAEQAEKQAAAGDWNGSLAAVAESEALVHGDLLACEAEAAWVGEARAQFRRRRADLLELVLAIHIRQEEWSQATVTARLALAADPRRESIYRQLMHAYIAQGEQSLALRTYEECHRTLTVELGAEPSPATQQLYRKLLPLPATGTGSLRHNLPIPLTSFVGRAREVVQIRSLLTSNRLVTLTGAGGSGKTRLALEAAPGALDQFADGIWLAELAALTEPALVPKAVATLLGISEEVGRPITQTLAEQLRDQQLLLILDNCEHLRDSCTSLASHLLSFCPDLRILATSRESLELAGEVTWQVPSLTEQEAIALFCDRASLSQPAFHLTSSNEAAIRQVCRRLDGIPLAIELAAARTRFLPVDQIDARLDDRFTLLQGGNRGALPRHQTLRALVDWSHDLLTEPEQALWRRLSVFAGGFTLEAAEAVGAGDLIPTADVLPLLSHLVSKSLVLAEPSRDQQRFRMLETIRQYGEERLAAAGEAAAVRSHHQAWFLALAEQAEIHLTGPEQAIWLARLGQEHDNLRLAIQWSLDCGQHGAGLRVASALWRFWYVRGHFAEGRDRFSRLLSLPGPADEVRGKALNGAGVLAYNQGDFRNARPLYEESLTIARSLRNSRGVARALNNLGLVARAQADYETARSLYEEALLLNRKLGNQIWEAWNLNNLGNVYFDLGDVAAARSFHLQALGIQRASGETWGIAMSLQYLGDVASIQRLHAEAAAMYEESLAIRRSLGERRGIANCLSGLGNLAHRRAEFQTAARLHSESLSIRRELGDQWGIAHSLEEIAALSVIRLQPDRALRLAGAAACLRDGMGAPLPPVRAAELDRDLQIARMALGTRSADLYLTEGRSLSLHQALALAVDVHSVA